MNIKFPFFLWAAKRPYTDTILRGLAAGNSQKAININIIRYNTPGY
jgi:hypothetical protein